MGDNTNRKGFVHVVFQYRSIVIPLPKAAYFSAEINALVMEEASLWRMEKVGKLHEPLSLSFLQACCPLREGGVQATKLIAGVL